MPGDEPHLNFTFFECSSDFMLNKFNFEAVHVKITPVNIVCQSYFANISRSKKYSRKGWGIIFGIQSNMFRILIETSSRWISNINSGTCTTAFRVSLHLICIWHQPGPTFKIQYKIRGEFDILKTGSGSPQGIGLIKQWIKSALKISPASPFKEPIWSPDYSCTGWLGTVRCAVPFPFHGEYSHPCTWQLFIKTLWN
jgi:hypothetical protein